MSQNYAPRVQFLSKTKSSPGDGSCPELFTVENLSSRDGTRRIKMVFKQAEVITDGARLHA